MAEPNKVPAGNICTIVGRQWGNYTVEETGELRPYASIFVVQAFENEQSANYHFEGEQAMKHKCIPGISLDGIEFGQRVQLFFNSKGKVNYMIPIAEDGV